MAGCFGLNLTMVAASSDEAGVPSVAQRRAQSALLRVSRPAEGRGALGSTGVYISGEGHALCSPRGFSGNELPTILNSNSDAVEVESIMAVYPEQAVILVKLTERPAEWLTLSKEPVPLGCNVAFLHPGQMPPVHSGTIMAKRLGRAPSRPNVALVPLLSIGTQAPWRQTSGEMTLRSGDPLIDGQGRICGVFHGINRGGTQLFIEAAPVDALFDRINAAMDKEDPEGIPFPLSPEINPYDPASEKPAYHQAVASLGEGRIEEALRHVEMLLEDDSTSAMVRLLQLDILLAGERMEELQSTVDELSQPNSKVRFNRVSLLYQKAWIAEHSGDFDAAIAAYEELIELTPPEFPGPREGLGKCYLEKGDATRDKAMWQEAEEWYRAARAANPESIGLLRDYQKTLDSLGRWDESTAITTRIVELNKIYRQR